MMLIIIVYYYVYFIFKINIYFVFFWKHIIMFI